MDIDEIEELHNSHSPKAATAHSAYTASASNLYHWIRWGDATGDTETTIKCSVHSGFVLDKNSAVTGTKILNH